MIPVQLYKNQPLEGLQAIELNDVAGRLQLVTLLNRVTHRLWELLEPASATRVPAFISYAQSDGLHLAKRVTAFLAAGGSTEAFFAPRDVPAGDDWRAELRRHAGRGVLLAIRTDAYGGREWCQIEVLEAKRAGMPVVVLDALARRESRGFPYLGNGPVQRWRSRDPALRLEELHGLMLREALRFRYFAIRVERLWSLRRIDARRHVQPTPPELLTLLERTAAADAAPLLVYPDPPLGSDELAVIRRLDERMQPVTPLMILAS